MAIIRGTRDEILQARRVARLARELELYDYRASIRSGWPEWLWPEATPLRYFERAKRELATPND